MIQPISLLLESNTDLLKSLEELAMKENKFGYVLSIVGNLSVAKFKCPGKQAPTLVKDHLEIIALNGTISPKQCHLHISISDGDCNVWAGHLEEGTKILKTADLLIGFLDQNHNNTKPINSKNENKKVEIYILPDCPWSSRAVRMLRTLQIPHDVKLIKCDSDFKIIRERSNYSSFPQIFINGKFIGGYSELADLHASGDLIN